jgi:hypothetical protein
LLALKTITWKFLKILFCEISQKCWHVQKVRVITNFTFREGSLFSASVADPDPGSGAFLTLRPRPGIGFSGSRILDPKIHIFDSLMTNFWVNSSLILRGLDNKISLSVQKQNFYLQFYDICDYKK